MKRLYRVALAIFILILIAGTPLAAAMGRSSESHGSFLSKSLLDFSGNWTTSVPYDHSITLVKQLPMTLEDDAVLCFMVNCIAAEVRVDGQTVLSHGADPDNPFGIPFGSLCLLAPIPAEAAGGEVSVTLTSVRNRISHGDLGQVWLGNRYDAVLAIFKSSLSSVIFALSCFLLSGIFFLGGLYAALRGRALEPYKSLLFLAVFALLAGTWVLTDSPFLQFVGGNVGVVFLLSFISFMLMPAAFCLFIRSLQILRPLAMDCICILLTVNATVCLLLHLLGLIPLTVSVLAVHIVLIASVIALFVIALRELVVHRNKKVWRLLTGMILLTICSFVALVQFYINPIADRSLWFRIGLFSFIVCLSFTAVRQMMQILKENATTSLYKQLAYVDIMTGLKNRTAFEADMKQLDKEKITDLVYGVFDINDLKTVNDTMGHAEGDRLIRRAAEGVQQCFGKIGDCYRIGGDEFVVCVRGARKVELEAGQKALQSWLQAQDTTDPLQLDLAWGFAWRESAWQSAEGLFQQADRAMYAKKQQAKSTRTPKKP